MGSMKGPLGRANARAAWHRGVLVGKKGGDHEIAKKGNAGTTLENVRVRQVDVARNID